jgi:catechol 2,3-dioxygenase-like lactoylglutathione lyase family enzyme
MASIRLESVSPMLAVRDLPEALASYRSTLGFEQAWSWGAPRTWPASAVTRWNPS